MIVSRLHVQIGYGVNESAGETVMKNDANKNLIKRFNFHSTMILKSTLGSETNGEQSAGASRMEDDENVAKKVRLSASRAADSSVRHNGSSSNHKMISRSCKPRSPKRIKLSSSSIRIGTCVRPQQIVCRRMPIHN